MTKSNPSVELKEREAFKKHYPNPWDVHGNEAVALEFYSKGWQAALATRSPSPALPEGEDEKAFEEFKIDYATPNGVDDIGEVYHWACKWHEAWQASRAEDRWLPIESAPRDGTPIIVHGPDANWPSMKHTIIAAWSEGLGGRWQPQWTGDGYFAATHWQLLPLPPKESSHAS